MKVLKKDLIDLLSHPSYHPLSLEQLASYFRIKKRERKSFCRFLEQLIREALIVKTEKKRYKLLSQKEIVTGIVKKNPRGFGFLIPDDKSIEDIYLPQKSLTNILNGDRVSVIPQIHRRGPRLIGKIIKIIERAKSEIIGRVEKRGQKTIIIPQGKKAPLKELLIDTKGIKVKEGDIAVAQITTFPQYQKEAQGKIIKRLGEAGDLLVDIEAIIQQYSLPNIFSKKTLLQTEEIPETIPKEEIKNRVDLRDLFTVTIDGEKARDFDDAVSIEKHSGFTLWVSIADVNHYVPFGSPLDQDAYERGSSVYFPELVIPMFPEKLSNNLCSLIPHQDRLCLTAELEFSPQGERKSYKIYKSVINSHHRLTYTKVKKIIDGEKSPFSKKILEMNELAKILRQNKRARGCLDFDLPEPEIILNAQGRIEDIIKSERNEAHYLIEEFMIAANEAVAFELNKYLGIAMYRIHEKPDIDNLISFHQLVKNLGYQLPSPFKQIDSKIYSQLLTKIIGKAEEKLINNVLLRSMKQARYFEKNIGHFGLSSCYYTHFTSPIRRYPDLIVHRLIKKLMEKQQVADKKDERINYYLKEAAEHLSKRERVADEAERELMDLRKAQFIGKHLGEDFWGHIAGVAEIGFWVELEKYFIDGLVSVRSLNDDYYQFIENEYLLRGRRMRKEYRLGDRVQIRVSRINLDRREIDFKLVEG